MRWAVSLLVLLALAVGAWCLLGERDAGEGDGGAIDRSSGTGSTEDLVTLRGRDATGAARTAAGESAAAAEDASPASEAAGYVLRGDLSGFDPSRPGAARVRVYPVNNGWIDRNHRPVAGVAAADGTFVLDVTALFAYRGTLTHLEILVDHPAYVQGRGRADITAARAAGRGELRVEISLRLGLPVTGEVVTETGRPIPGADVAIFRGRGERPTGPSVPVPGVARTQTDAEGRYRLRVAQPGFHRVVAIAETRLPAGAGVELRPGGTAHLPPLVLRPGVVLAGQVRFRGEGVPGVWLEAVPEGHENVAALEIASRRVAWRAHGPAPSTTWTQTDAEGRFRIEGLAPVPHTLDPSNLHAEGLPVVTPLAGLALRREVHAPAEDVVVDVTGAVLAVRVEAEDRPVTDAEVEVRTDEIPAHGKTDDAGEVLFLIAPGAACKVTVQKDGFRDGRLDLSVGATGTTEIRRVVLERDTPKPVLVVSFQGPHARSLTRAAFSLENREMPGRMPVERFQRDPDATHAYRVEQLEAGRYELTIRPGAGPWDQTGYFLQEVHEVAIPDEGEVRLEVALRLGGRLRIAARDEAGAVLGARCVIRNAIGEEQPARFTAQAETRATSGVGRLGTLSPSSVGPPLPAGTYTIELSQDGYWPQSVLAEVTVNETTEIDVTLAPR